MDKAFFDKAISILPDVCFKRPPDYTIILGSGWGNALQADRHIFTINYANIPGLGSTTVAGHNGEMRLYDWCGKRILAFCGRRHYYEGVGWESVVLPVEICRRIGGKRIILTNASGGINSALHPGDFVILRDHINTTGLNPLIGEHNPEWGERFPDMSEVYSLNLRNRLHKVINSLGIRVLQGIYAFTLGPTYETPAEIRGYAHLGADVVGMSTVPEAIFAHACGLEVVGLSLVTNLAAGISPHPLSHEEVIQASQRAQSQMVSLLETFMKM